MHAMKRFMAILICIVLLFSLSAFAWASENGYADVSGSEWYAEAVATLRETGIMNGVGDHRFDPDGVFTRAQLATVLYRLADKPAVNGKDGFTDTEPGAWYSDAVLWASQNGVVDGYGNGLFGTNDPTTQEQIAVMLWRSAGSYVLDDTYSDADGAENAASDWAVDAVRWARVDGLLTEAIPFEPAKPATRAQVADMVHRYLQLLERFSDVDAVSGATPKADEDSGAAESQDGYRGIDVVSPDWVGRLEAAGDAEQMLIVAAFSEEATVAWVSLHEKQSDGSWHMIMTSPGFIGKNGLGKTMEGDGKTPSGVFHFNRAFGIADDPGCAIPYVKVDEDTYWSGDPRDGFRYNELVSLKDLPGLDVESGDSEHIIDYPYHYQYCLNISYNEAGTPGLGSAIFLHCLAPAKPFTGGCVSIPEDHMRYVMQKVSDSTAVVIDTYALLSGGEAWPDSTWPQER